MKIRAQIAMVLNLDKCIGCHTCSVTCKNVWTNREGMEYAWFNNVETKPGIGYPKDWENQERWNGGWVRKRNGKLQPKIGGKWRVLAKIFANPDLPEIDDYYEPFTFDYEHLQKAPELRGLPDRAPALADHRRAHGEDRVGPELGGDPGRRVLQALGRLQLRGRAEGDLRPVREHLHDVPAAAVRALPQPGVRGGLPLRRHLQARGGRHRPHRPGQVPRLAHVRVGLPLQEDLLQLVERQIREVHLLLSAHRGGPADGVLGDLRRPHPLPRRRALRRRRHREGGERQGREGPLRGPALDLPRSERPRGDRPGPCRRRAGRVARGRQEVADLEDGDGMEGRLPAASRVPHAADGVVRAAALADPVGGRGRQDGQRRRHARRALAAHPAQVPRQPAHRRRRGAGRARPGAHARHARLHAGQDHRRRDRREHRQQGRRSPAGRSRTCTRSWRSPTTRTGS